MSTDELYTELRRLSRGRGAPSADLTTLAAYLPQDGTDVLAALRDRIELLPVDLRLVALTALGLDPNVDHRFLQRRISWLAATLRCDDRTVRRRIEEAFRRLAAQVAPPSPNVPSGDSLRVPFLGTHVMIDVAPIEMLSDIDVLVASGNTYLEQPQTYKSSTSAALRRAAAQRGPAGDITDDVLSRELDAWITGCSRPGVMVAPGTVVPLSPGALSDRGVRRVYYAAVASPRVGEDDYDIEPSALMAAVSNVFASAAADPVDPPLRSIAIPALGAGRGRLSAAESAHWIGRALTQVLTCRTDWDVHLVTRNPATASTFIRHLGSETFRP